jgi:endonuclease YncB( thermonuclease family)
MAGNWNLMQKAPHCGAFLLLLLIWLSTNIAIASCTPYQGGEVQEVSHVYDGDTVKLADGRNVRLIGINTPEMGRDGKKDEPGAKRALRHLESLVRASDQRVYMLIGTQQTDRYGRQLAHLYDKDGNSINESLLRDGLGYVITIPPNVRNIACYQAAESQARKSRRGLWRSASIPLEAEKLTGKEEGFYLIEGRIGRIGKSRNALWLNLVQGPALRIDRRNWQEFTDFAVDDLSGKRLEVRGWLYHRKGQQRMSVRHPASLHWLEY